MLKSQSTPSNAAPDESIVNNRNKQGDHDDMRAIIALWTYSVYLYRKKVEKIVFKKDLEIAKILYLSKYNFVVVFHIQ